MVNLKYLILESLIVPDGEMEEYDYRNLISIFFVRDRSAYA